MPDLRTAPGLPAFLSGSPRMGLREDWRCARDVPADGCFLAAICCEKAQKLLCHPEKSCGAGGSSFLHGCRNKGRFHTGDPRPGDQNSFGLPPSNSMHTGIVESVDQKQVHTIGGGTGSQAVRRNAPLTNRRISGHGGTADDAAGSGARA